MTNDNIRFESSLYAYDCLSTYLNFQYGARLEQCAENAQFPNARECYYLYLFRNGVLVSLKPIYELFLLYFQNHLVQRNISLTNRATYRFGYNRVLIMSILFSISSDVRNDSY